MTEQKPFDNDIREAIQALECPHKVDVTDNVMKSLDNLSIMVPKRRINTKRIAIAAAACLIVALGVQFTLLLTHDFNSTAVNSMMAELYEQKNQYYTEAENYEQAIGLDYLWSD